MFDVITRTAGDYPRYAGLRMTAAEYLALPDDGYQYELIDGVVLMSPSPDFGHPNTRAELLTLLRNYLRGRGLGVAVADTDVTLDGDVVYRPDILFVRAANIPPGTRRLDQRPDLVVEVLSPGTQVYDLNTKRRDYQRAGIPEYWIVDYANRSIRFLRLKDGRYEDVTPSGGEFQSAAVPGFMLRIDEVWTLRPPPALPSGMVRTLLSLAAAAALAGCSSVKPPNLKVVSAQMTERTEHGAVVEFVLEADNPNDLALPLTDVTYSLDVDGVPVFAGTRTAEATVRRYGRQLVTIPAVITATPAQPLPPVARYSIRGELVYEVPGDFTRTLFDIEIRRPTATFEGEGTVELPASGAGR